jgi:hypothetical protein
VINLNNLEQNSIIIYVNTLAVENNPWGSNNFLFIFTNGFARVPISVVPNILVQNTRYTKFSIDLVDNQSEDPLNGMVSLREAGNWDYELWAIDAPSLDPDPGVLIDRGQMFLDNGTDEITPVVYVSDNEDSQSVVYLTTVPNECAVWNTFPDIWNISALKWGDCN